MTKQEFKEKIMQPKVAVHVPTKELDLMFRTWLDSEGIKNPFSTNYLDYWNSVSSYEKNNDKTCHNVAEGLFCSIDYYINQGDEIIEFKPEYIKDEPKNYLFEAVKQFMADNGLTEGEIFATINNSCQYKFEKGNLLVKHTRNENAWDSSLSLHKVLTGEYTITKINPIQVFFKKYDLKENEIFTTLESNGNGSYKIKDNQIYFFILGDRWAKTALTISKLETFGVKKIDPIQEFMTKHNLKDSEPFTDGDSLPYRIKDNRLQYIKINGVWANSSLTIHGFDSGVKIEKADMKAWMVKVFMKKHDIKDGEKFYIDKRPNECIKYFIEDNVIYHLVKSVSTWMDIEPEKLLVAKVEKIDPLKEKLEKFMKDNNLRDGEVFGSGCPDHEYKIESGVLYYKCYKGPALDNPWIKSSYCNELDIDCFLNSKVFILPPKPFKPKKGEQYWYFNNLMKQVTCSTNNNGSGELLRVYHGMAYRTKQEAEANKAKDLAIYESVKQDSEPKPDKLQDVPNCKYCTAPITQEIALSVTTDDLDKAIKVAMKRFEGMAKSDMVTPLHNIITQFDKTVIDEMFKQILDSHRK